MVSLEFVNDVILYFFRPHYGPVVDSASNRNEYQEYGTELQVGRSYVRFPMVSLEFVIDVILYFFRPHYGLWLTQRLTEMSTRNMALSYKSEGRVFDSR